MNASLKHTPYILAVVFASMLAIPVKATTLYSFGVNSQTPPAAGLSMTGGAVAANSFSLSSIGTLRSVSLYTLECCNSVWSGTISYYLFTNNGSSPSSAPFAQGSTTVYNRTGIYSDNASNEVVEYAFNLATPETLSANTTYWLGIGMTSGGSGPAWNAAVPTSGLSARSSNGAFNNWVLQGHKGAFSLSDTTFQPVPEPDSAWMLLEGSGLMCLGYWKRRSRCYNPL
jgi:hypothetical protein